MNDSAPITIRRNFPRPDPGDVQAFAGLSSGWAADANGRRGAMDYRLRPVTTVGLFAGVALTVATAPNDNLLAYAAVTVAQPGDVIFIATENFDGAAVIGDIFGGFARNKGVAAVVTDGLVRDLDGLEALGLPVFARGVSPNSPQKKGPGEIGGAITLGGLHIESGDLVVGDHDGVVVISRANIPSAVAALGEIRDKEQGAERAISAGATEPGWLAETLQRIGVREID
jgi:4-hydroxy-4-methyl-2-oxoglutarate aldolase